MALQKNRSLEEMGIQYGLLAPARALRERMASALPRSWSLAALAGQLVELSGPAASASLTAAAALIGEAHEGHEPTAWITARETSFYPPDLAAAGIDLAALPVVRVVDPRGMARAAELLLRSGGFGLIVIDLGPRALAHAPARPGAARELAFPAAVLARLAGLAAKHRTLLLCLTRKGAEAPSLGARVTVRGEGRKVRAEFDRFAWELRILKDRRSGEGWHHEEVCRGPDGLC